MNPSRTSKAFMLLTTAVLFIGLLLLDRGAISTTEGLLGAALLVCLIGYAYRPDTETP